MTILETDGFGPVRVEIYLLPKRAQEQSQVTVSAAGTTVYSNITDFEIEDFAHPPWSEGRLNGLIDFAALTVAPGTRRGVVPDQAALAFAGAVKSLEPQILEEMALESPKRKLRYLASLLAKEIVAHSFPSPQAGSILERMVEVLTITDQRL